MQREIPSPATADREQRERIVARFLIAVATSATADVLWWQRQPRQLTGPIDIVGHPTFANFDYIPSFVAYRLVVYAFPVGALVVYSLLAWWGPLRRPANARRKRATAQMLDLPAAEPVAVPVAGPVSVAGRGVAAAARLLLPTFVVVVATSTASTGAHQGITTQGLWCGLGYLVGVPVLAAAIACWRTSPSQPWRVRVRSAIPAVNGIAAAMASVFGLWFVSLHSVVVVRSDSSTHHWPWLPAWLAVLGMLAVAAWGVLRLRSGRAPAAVEKRLLAVVVGAAAVFLVTSWMPGQLGAFRGSFDDAPSLVGANLLSKGYFPWRDFLFIHGLWMDALQTTVGFGVFGGTRWGSEAGGTVLLGPIYWVIIYLFAVWFSRSNRWFLIGLGLLLLAGIPVSLDLRFILVPVTLVLLGEMLRRRRFGWCAAFMVAAFSQAVLVPETLFLAIPALLVVVAADLTHRVAGRGIWPSLRRSQWCAAAGVVLLLAWCAFLAVNHSLGAWIDYFKIFGPGHNAEGAFAPAGIRRRQWAEFGLSIGVVLVTLWSVVARVRAGRSWSPRDWVTVAAAGFVAIYAEKALGRFDVPHVDEVFTAALPLVLLWSEQLATAADGLVRATASGARRASLVRGALAVRNPATALVVTIVVLMTVPLARPSVLAAVNSIPSREHATSGAEAAIPRLGYAAPGAVNPSLLRDLAAVLDTYAGKDEPVFDMSNSLGYIYYLLDRRPANPFVHVSMAITPYSQELLVGDLRQSRPAVVIFDSMKIGHGSWDGIRNNVRHYEVSQYLLRGWQPVIATHGVLLLLRNDLMAGRPPLPRLTVPPVSTYLWFRGPACNWGSVPNFLRSPASGSSAEVPVTPRGQRVVTRVEGWAVDSAARAPVRKLVLASGRTVLAAVSPYVQRPDLVAAVGGYALGSGFSAAVVRRPGGGAITVYGLAADGMLHPLAGQRHPLLGGVLTLAHGRKVRIGAPIRGHVDHMVSQAETIGVAQIPSGVTIAGYDLLTLHAAGPIGPSDLTISDLPGVVPSHAIYLHALPSSGGTLGVRVGSCLQWHGFTSRALYVTQTGGAPIGLLQLSGVG